MPRIGNVEVSDDVIASLSRAPRAQPGYGDIFGAAAQNAYGAVRYGIPYQVGKLEGTLSAEDEAFYRQGLRDTSAAASAAAPASLDDLTSGRTGFGRFVGENLVASLPYMASAAVGAIGGGLLGGPGGAVAGGIVGGTPQFSGLNVARAVDEEGGLSEAAAERSLVAAPLQSAADLAIARFLPGAGRLLGEAAATQTGGFIRRTASSIAQAGATEAVTEAGQQLGERYAAGLPTGNADAAAEYVNAAVTAFAIGGVLGAGGGFRRGPARMKPAEQVTPDDLSEAVDAALSGSNRAAAPTFEEQLGLALPGGSAAEVQTSLPLAGPQEVAEAPASQLPQLPLDPALSTVAPETQLELGQRFRDNITPSDLPLPGGAQVSPELEQALSGQTRPDGFAGPPNAALPAQRQADTALARVMATGLEPAAPVVDLPPSRVFKDISLEELETAINAKGAPADVQQAAQREVIARRREAAGLEPLTTDNFQTRIDELKSGLRGGFVQNVTAENPQQLVEKVYDQIFTEQDTRTNTTKFAQRLGIIDENLEPTDLARSIEAQRATSATTTTAEVPAVTEQSGVGGAQSPVAAAQGVGDAAATGAGSAPRTPTQQLRSGSPAFSAEVELEMRDARKAAGIERSTTTKDLQTPSDVFRALADDPKVAASGRVTQVERLAQELGLITKDDARDVTPKGRQVYLSSSEGLTDAVNAAQQQGYTGRAASVFERGVRAAVSGQDGDATFDGFEDLATYEAGKVWARDFIQNGDGTRTAAQTDAIRTRLSARNSRGEIVDRVAASRRELTPLQVQQRSLNSLLDAADLRKVNDSDQAALRRMVRDGATPDEVGLALQRVQGGKTLFREASEAQRPQLMQPTGRGQPLFREMYDAADNTPTRIQQRVETEAAVQAYELRLAAQLAETSPKATKATKTRVAKAAALLDEGKTRQAKQILKATPGVEIEAKPKTKRQRKAAVAPAAATFAPTGPAPQSYQDYAAQRITYNDMDAAGKAHFQALSMEENYQGLLENEPNLTREEYMARREGGMRMARAFLDGKFNAADIRDTQPGLVGDTDPAFEQAVTGKNFFEVADHMVTNAPSPYYREVMMKVRTLAQMLERQGMTFDFRVVGPQDTVPAAMNAPGTKALTHTRFHTNPSAVVYINNAEMGPDSALNYQVAAHEMLHAVTALLTAYGRNPENYGKTKLGKSVAALDDLLGAVQQHLRQRQAAGRLNDFEQRFLDRDNNTLEDIDELLAWGLTNPEMQRYLNGIEYKPKQSVFTRLIHAVRDMLGMEPRHDSVLGELLRVSEQVFTTPRAELQALLPRNNPDSDLMVPKMAAARDGGISAQNRTVEASNEAVQTAVRAVSAAAERVSLQDMGVRARRVALGWVSHNQLDRQYGDKMPGLLKHSEAKREQAAVRGRWAQMGVEAYQTFEKLERENPKAAKRVGELMAASTEFRLDPDKTWEEHTHLINDPNAARLKQLHGDVVKLANDLKRGDGAGWKMYNHFRALNEAQNFARMAAGLHERVATDPELSLGVADATVNPVDAFMRAEGVTTPEAVRDYWQQALDAQIAAATGFIREKKGEAATSSDQDLVAMRQHLSPIEMQITAIHEARAGMAKAPYFHLGRFGDHFGSAMIRKTKEGIADPEAQQYVAQALEAAGFGDAQISADNTRPRFSLRFETVDQSRQFRKLMEQLKAEGWLDQDTPIKSGPRTQEDSFGTAEGLPDYVQRYIQAIEASAMYQPTEGMTAQERAAVVEARQRAVQLAVDTWIEQQPDTSISKVLVKRYAVPGYNKDMIRNFAHRWNVGSTNIANIAAAPKFNQAFVEMRAQANEALETGAGDEYVLADLLREVRIRDVTNPLNETADTFDKLRAVGHAYYLGFSPAYGLINMTQLGVVALPELAKQHGYSKSFHAMRRASTKALAILKIANQEARALGPKHWADITLTENTLRKAGLSGVEVSFANRMIAAGTIDIGSAARAFGQITDADQNSRLEIGLKYASAIGLYTETFSRLTTALAAQELHSGDVASAEKYATNVVSNSMFDYQNWNTARQLGKQGFIGPVTPLVTQFMSYSVQITEKLYSEFMDATTRSRPGESETQSKARKTAARRFLFGHVTAVTALAGTLGMPFATVFAAVIERLVDAFDDDEDPFDATAAWRNFLADTFGEGAAEVVARGLPRAFGFDISARAGEADLLPFSQLISDRRSWKESVEGYLGRSIGASPNMLLSVAEGGSQFAEGNWLSGSIAFMPVSLKAPLQTYRMTQDGYVDSRGTRLPMTPTASSYLWQLLGFSPAAKAEYGEARQDQQARRGVITRRAGVLRQGIIKAIEDGNTERAQELVAEAQEFDRDNPSFSVLGSLAESMRRRQQVRERSSQLSAPMGVSMQDVAGQRRTEYANIEFTP